MDLIEKHSRKILANCLNKYSKIGIKKSARFAGEIISALNLDNSTLKNLDESSSVTYQEEENDVSHSLEEDEEHESIDNTTSMNSFSKCTFADMDRLPPPMPSRSFVSELDNNACDSSFSEFSSHENDSIAEVQENFNSTEPQV